MSKNPDKDKITFRSEFPSRRSVNVLNQKTAKLQEKIEELERGQARNKSNFDAIQEENIILKEDITRLKEEMEQLRMKCGAMSTSIRDAVSAETSTIMEQLSAERELKEPRTEEQLQTLRGIICKFNERNKSKMKDGRKPKTFGVNGSLTLVRDLKSLHAWFVSDYAKSIGIGTRLILKVSDFDVCVVDDKLVTISRDYKDGVGPEIFWTRNEEYKRLYTPSTSYKSTECFDDDPRRNYKFKGVRWTPPTGKGKKRSLSET